MNISRFPRFLLGAGVAAILASCAAQPAAQTVSTAPQSAEAVAPAPRFVNLEAFAERYVAEGKVANMVIGVSAPGMAPAWINEGTLAFGNTTPADEQSIYRIYSMTKPIIGVATSILISEGRIGLDQPLSDFFPAFAEMHVLTSPDSLEDTVAAKNAITIRHLLTHTSGLSYSLHEGPLGDEYRRTGIVPGQRRPNPFAPAGAQPASLDEFMRRVAALPLKTEPGTEWHYSISIDVLGAVIEKVTGMPLESYLQQAVFGPLGMDDTGFVVPTESLPRLTSNYFMMNGQLIPVDQPDDSEYASAAPFPSGGGGLAGTAEDYLRFMTAMANGGRLGGRQALPAAAVELATSNLLPRGVTFSAFGSEGQGYGAGGRLIVDGSGGDVVGSYGWGGAAGTLASAMPNERVGLVMMTQYMPMGTYPELNAEMAAALRADLAAMAGAR